MGGCQQTITLRQKLSRLKDLLQEETLISASYVSTAKWFELVARFLKCNTAKNQQNQKSLVRVCVCGMCIWVCVCTFRCTCTVFASEIWDVGKTCGGWIIRCLRWRGGLRQAALFCLPLSIQQYKGRYRLIRSAVSSCCMVPAAI